MRGFRINEDEAYNFSKLHAERSASVGSPETPTETVYTVNVPAADLDADSVALRVLAADRPEDRIREVVGRILWSKVTAIGGGRCYLNTNLDDVVNELAAALSSPSVAESPTQHHHRWETVGIDGFDGKSDLNWCDECGALSGRGGISAPSPSAAAQKETP